MHANVALTCVWPLDRLGGDPKHPIMTLDELTALGIAFTARTKASTRRCQRAGCSLRVGSVAEFERARIVEWVDAARLSSHAECTCSQPGGAGDCEPRAPRPPTMGRSQIPLWDRLAEIRNGWVPLSSILETAVEYKHLQTNPARGVKFPQKVPKEARTDRRRQLDRATRAC